MRLGIGSASPRLLKSRTSCVRIRFILFRLCGPRAGSCLALGQMAVGPPARVGIPYPRRGLRAADNERVLQAPRFSLSRQIKPLYVEVSGLAAGRVNNSSARVLT